MTDAIDTHRRSRRRRARRLALGSFYAIVVTFTLVLSAEVTWQIWAPSSPSRAQSCRQGLAGLDAALDMARTASEGAEGTPDEVLARFRQAAAPAWSTADAVAASCRGDTEATAAFDVLERLRYAEESAIRRDARDLAPLRRRERALRPRLQAGAEK